MRIIKPGQLWDDGRRWFRVLRVHPSRATVIDKQTGVIASLLLSRFDSYDLIEDAP